LNVPQGRQEAQPRSLEHGQGLGGHEELALGETVRQCPAEQGEKEDGQRGGGDNQADLQGGAGQTFGDQPLLGGGLHPRAGERDELAAEIKTIVPVPERPEKAEICHTN